jgi:two-component system cell cycle response regulator CpdR
MARREGIMDPAAAHHILVVEDDDSFRRLVTRMLERAGYRVTAAADFDAAIQVIDGPEPIDLLLTDIGMPEGTPHGVSISRVAEFRRTGLKILYMTGGQDVTKFVQFAPGAIVLDKPFTAAQLTEAITAALG